MELALSQKLDGLVSLLNTWRGTMLFPPGSSDEPKVDLCSHSGSDSYVFHCNKYCGEKSMNDIRRDLLLAAKYGGFDLMTKSSGGTKVAACVKRRQMILK